jgi:hypothetical protein
MPHDYHSETNYSETRYFDGISEGRVLDLWRTNPDRMMRGGGLSSVETRRELEGGGIYSFIREHFGDFLRFVSRVPPREQDILLCYYLVGVEQTTLGRLFGVTQTVMSQKLRKAMRAAAAYVLWGDPLSQVGRILEKTGTARMMGGRIEEAIRVFERTSSFYWTSVELGDFPLANPEAQPKAEVRRRLTELLHLWEASTDQEVLAMAAYLHLLLRRPSGARKNEEGRKEKDRPRLRIKDPNCLGKSTINITSPNFDRMFPSKANWEN